MPSFAGMTDYGLNQSFHKFNEDGMKVWRWFWRGILIAGVLLLAMPAHAAPPTLTKEQQQLLQQLSPAEREQLLRSLQRSPRTAKATPSQPESASLQEPEAPADSAAEAGTPQTPRLKAADTILIRFRREDTQDAADRTKLGPEASSADALVPDQKLIVLDQFAAITLEKAGRIVLKGLNESEAAERIEAEPAFKGLRVSVKLLPIEEPLKPFGYDLFTATQRTFAPATDISVPADYVVGPGDIIVLQLFGKENAQHELEVTRDGNVLFPGIGPITVAGLKFSELEQKLKSRVQKQMIGMKVAVTLGKLRSIRVFILGDVERPGSYAISGLSTLTNALFASGGVKRIGSLRDIQIKRSGKTISRLDLYDLLLRGDNSADVRLLPGDVIFISPIGKTAGIAGRVRRPAIYELKDEKTVGDLIAMAGGLAPDAYPQVAKVERILENRDRTVLSVDLSKEEGKATELHDGDVVKIHTVVQQVEGAVTLVGHVYRPGDQQWRPDMRVSQLIPSLSALLPGVDARYLLIKREDPIDHSITFFSTDLIAALAQPGSDVDVALQPRDEVHVFSLRAKREALIKPLLEQARLRTGPDKPVPEVGIEGVVHHPGVYPLSSGMRVSDLLRAAGGLTDRAYTVEAELTRFTVIAGKEREQSRLSVDVAAILKNESAQDTPLKAYDRLVIRRIPKWDEQGVIELAGEVRFPGKYPVVRNEKLSDVLKRAGGLTEQAYPKGSIFVRESVRQREQEHLERLAGQLERELAFYTVQGPEVGVKKEAAVAEGQVLLRQLRTTKAAGRMVIKVDALLDGRERYDVVVQSGDKLHIPQRPQEVTVLGEVYYPTSHLFDDRSSTSDYVDLSGGVTEKGNKRAIYVVRADGSVSVAGRWFRPDPNPAPGDTVIVPLKVDRVSGLKLFTDISTVVFQLAVTVAALNAIGVF